MNKEIKMPVLNTKTQNGTLVSWEKKVGETVQEGDVLYEIETDKAIHEVVATDDGTLTEIFVSEGDEIKSGDLLAKLQMAERG